MITWVHLETQLVLGGRRSKKVGNLMGKHLDVIDNKFTVKNRNSGTLIKTEYPNIMNYLIVHYI